MISSKDVYILAHFILILQLLNVLYVETRMSVTTPHSRRLKLALFLKMLIEVRVRSGLALCKGAIQMYLCDAFLVPQTNHHLEG